MNRNTLLILGLGGLALSVVYLYCRGEVFESWAKFTFPYFVTGWEAQTGQRLPADLHEYANRLQQSPVHQNQVGQIKALMTDYKAAPCCTACAHDGGSCKG